MTSLALPATTMIGSLPHHNIDAALEFSFRLGVPFLPQIPIRNPWEYMIAHALEGIPGLEPSEGGSAILDPEVWRGRARRLDERIASAFEQERDIAAFRGFEPSAPTSSGWHPFLWECEDRRVTIAKFQIAGPITAQTVLQLKDGTSATSLDGLSTQIFRLVLARSLAMCRRARQLGIRPLIFLDEPALFGLTADQPRHILLLQELRLMIQALKRDGATVGLHCCSEADWNAILPLGLDFLSIDADLSLGSLLKRADGPLRTYLANGGRLSLGVIPTQRQRALSQNTPAGDATALLNDLQERFVTLGGFNEHETWSILSNSLYTPACGLALHSPSEAEEILAALLGFYDHLKRSNARAGASSARRPSP